MCSTAENNGQTAQKCAVIKDFQRITAHQEGSAYGIEGRYVQYKIMTKMCRDVGSPMDYCTSGTKLPGTPRENWSL